MNATIRGLKGFLALCALACLGLLLRWVTDGSIAAATPHDLTAMASLAIGAVAWVAYCWLVLAVLATVLEQIPGAIGQAASLVAARITSHGSRALLRSALGVAAVTPLTIGLAHATPGQTQHHHPHTSTTNPHTTHQLPSSPTRPWTATEPRSTIDLTPAASTARHSASAESRTAAACADGSQLSISAKPGPTSAGSGAAGRPTDGTQAGVRPWSAVEPRSTVEVGGDSLSEWRANEAPSSVQLTEQTGSTPSTASRTARTARSQASDQAKTANPNRTPTTGPPAQHPHQQTRTGAPTAKQPPTNDTAVPEQSSAKDTAIPEQSSARHTAVPEQSSAKGIAVPEQPARERDALREQATRGRGVGLEGEPVERVVVPDRPTAGAPTRYTHLQSGQVARPGSRVVKPGDSLWTIAAAELGPAASDDAVAARWPQWYAANRQLIGPDPNLIQPGQVLNPPPPSHPVPPTNQEK